MGEEAKIPQEQEDAAGPGSGAPVRDGVPRQKAVRQPPDEIGGADGPEPTHYGDWQHKGRVTDF